MKVDIKFKKEVEAHVLRTIRVYGIEKTKKIVSNVIHELSEDGDAIHSTYQILYYAYFLKLLKEEFHN